MDIRFANTGDLPAIIGLLRQVGQVHHLGRPDLFRSGAQKYDEAALLQLLSDETRPILVATEDTSVLGYAFCILKSTENDPVLCDHRTFYIDDLCVDESCRGRGVGKTLYRAVLDYARTLHCQSVTLNVWACNENAMKFYEKMGLVPQKIGMEMILGEESC